MKRPEIIRKLEQLAITMAEDADDGTLFVPTRDVAELLKAAVLELEEAGKLLKLLPEKKGVNPKELARRKEVMKTGVETLLKEREMERAREAVGAYSGASIAMVATSELSDAIHAAQGAAYAKKFMDASNYGMMKGMRGTPVLYVGTDHAESFRHYLLSMVRDGARFVDKGPGHTEWMGMRVRRSGIRSSRVEWIQGEYRWAVYPEQPNIMHRTTDYGSETIPKALTL